MANNVMKIIKEGQAQLHVPKTVFYNPVQEFNRDLSVLVLKTYLKYNVWHHRNEEKHVNARGGLKILDALSASGLRSIRYAKELVPHDKIVNKIVANDISDTAVDLIRKNLELNQVQDKVTCSQLNAIHLLNSSSQSFDDRFHVIDLDPFGSGAQFFDAAVRSIGEAGLLMVTCTDVAVLCGNASESCFARYGSMSVRADFCHELALRIVLRSLEQHANVYGRYIKPLFSVSVDFYVRVYVQVFTQQAETKRSASKLSQLFLCRECKTHELNRLGSYEIKEDAKQAASTNLAVKYRYRPAEMQLGDRCKICRGKYIIGGPIWSEPIHDGNFLDLLKKELAIEETENQLKTYKRILGLVFVCSEELAEPALFHSINNMASALKTRMPPTKDILSALANADYQVSGTHCYQYGLKTDAPSEVVWDVFCELTAADVAKSLISNADSGAPLPLPARIMTRANRVTGYNFTYNPKIESDSQRLSLVRFQMNPAKEWGPKSRPAACSASDELRQQPRALDDKSSIESRQQGDNKYQKQLTGETNKRTSSDQEVSQQQQQQQQASKKSKLITRENNDEPAAT